MKKLLVLSAILLGALLGIVRADIPPMKPTVVTVKNLAAFPDFKFLYAFERENAAPSSLPDGKPITCERNVQLLVQSGPSVPQVWATVAHDWRGKRVTLIVDKVERRGKTIHVTYHDPDAPAPARKGADLGGDSRILFALAAGGAVGLVILARRRRPAA